MTAAAKALELAIRAGDPGLVAEAHLAIGRVRERLGPQLALVIKHEQAVERFQKERDAEATERTLRKAR